MKERFLHRDHVAMAEAFRDIIGCVVRVFVCCIEKGIGMVVDPSRDPDTGDNGGDGDGDAVLNILCVLLLLVLL